MKTTMKVETKFGTVEVEVDENVEGVPMVTLHPEGCRLEGIAPGEYEVLPDA